MTPAQIAAYAQAVAPLAAEDSDPGPYQAWFRGTLDQAMELELLRQHGVPGEDGRAKSFSVTIDGRRVYIWRYTKRLVRVCFYSTKAEDQALRETNRRQDDEREALKKAAELDARAAAFAELAARQPQSEDQFQQAAEDALWRAYCGFCHAFTNSVHPSGFYFDELVKDEIRGHIHSAIWAIRDAEVLHDPDRLQKPIQALRHQASKLDAPLQRFLASVKDAPVDLQEPRDE